MKRWRLLFKLEEEISISSRAASSGGHEGLPFIPGSALLGVAALKLYRILQQEQAFTLFHSGKVRFGNLYPISAAGLPMLPMPLSWQVEKDQKDHIDNNQLQAEKIYNGTANKKPKQAQQLRAGFVSDSGEYFLPSQNFRMKTAIDPKTGMADKSKIFGYQSLANDALWYADIEYDDSVDKNLIEELRKVFAEPVFFGRSRSSEYGKAQVYKIIEENLTDAMVLGKGEVSLWLESDLCLVNDLGMPVLEPKPEFFGLTGSIVWEKTFIRSRRFILFNSYRRTYEPERIAINAGSVLTFHLTEAGNLKNPSLYRETGLGRFMFNSPLLQGDHPTFSKAGKVLEKPADTPSAQPLNAAEKQFFDWLQDHDSFDQAKQDYEKTAKKWLQELGKIYPAACRFAGAGENFCLGPSASQWGSVVAEAKAATDNAQLLRKLFEGDHAICKADHKGWEQEFFLDNKIDKFATWFKNKAKDQDPRLIQIFATLAMKEVQNKMRQGAKR